jgi:hypothetical protein
VQHFAAAAVAVTLLAGCANSRAAGQAAINDVYAQDDVCEKKVANRPAYTALRAHFLAGEIPAGKLADNRHPTPEEARLRVALWAAEEPCREAFIDALASTSIKRPDAAQIWSAAHAENALLVERFANRDMTWGQYAQSIQTIRTAARIRLGAADAEARRKAAEASREAAERLVEIK